MYSARDKERQKIEANEAEKKSKYLRREREREMKWVEMTKNWMDYVGKHPVRTLCLQISFIT
jgi:hypothetical protein